MKYQKKPFKRMAAQVITYGTLAAFLTLAPPVYDSENGFFSYPAAHAKSCFVAGTRILMADGSWRAIERVRPGDRVVGEQGRINRVTEVERVRLDSRRLYGFNGGHPFVTAEHPFMTPHGWKSIDPAMTATETPALRVDRLAPGDDLMRVAHYDAAGSGGIDGALALAMEPLLELATERLTRIDSIEADPQTPLFNLLLDGNHSYIADDYLVHNKGGDDGGGSDDSGGSGDSGSDDGGGGDDSGGGDSGSDDSSGPGGGGDDGDDSSGSGSGGDDDDSADDSDGRDDDGRGRGRGRGSHGFDDSQDGPDDSFDGPDDSDGRTGDRRGRGSDDIQGVDDDRDRDRREQRSDRVRTEERIGLETAPDYQRTRTEQRFDAQGNLTRERSDVRIGQETAADFQRTRTEQRFDAQGNLTRERVSERVGPDDDGSRSQDDNPSADDSRSRSFSEAAVTPGGPDLSPDEEAAAISSGWQ